MRGGVDHEWHNFYDDTKPAALYGGTWEELPQGTFLRATGTNGSTTSGTAADGGSNAHTLTINEMPAHSHPLVKAASTGTGGIYDDGRTIQRGYAGGTSGIYDWTTLYNGTTEVGGGQAFDNEPQYKNCHIWRKVS